MSRCRILLGSFLACIAFLVAPVAFEAGKSYAQSTAEEEQVKAAFLYKFCYYTEWPEEAFEDEDSPVVIGVTGSRRMVRQLESVVQDRSIDGRPLSVRYIDQDDTVEGLHLLYIARSHKHRMPYLFSQARGYPVLLVTDTGAGLQAGGVISLFTDNNRIRFDISQMVAEQQGLRLSAQLLKVARTVEKP